MHIWQWRGYLDSYVRTLFVLNLQNLYLSALSNTLEEFWKYSITPDVILIAQGVFLWWSHSALGTVHIFVKFSQVYMLIVKPLYSSHFGTERIGLDLRVGENRQVSFKYTNFWDEREWPDKTVWPTEGLGLESAYCMYVCMYTMYSRNTSECSIAPFFSGRITPKAATSRRSHEVRRLDKKNKVHTTI